MLGEDCLFVFPLTLFSYLFPCLPFGLHIEFMRGLILCGVIYGRTVQTTPTPCTGQTTARLKGSSVHQLPPTVLSKFSPTAPAHTASLEPWYVHSNQEDNHYVKGKDIHWNFILLMHFSFFMEILERAVQPFWPWDASSAVRRGLSTGHPGGDTAAGGAAFFTHTGRTGLCWSATSLKPFKKGHRCNRNCWKPDAGYNKTMLWSLLCSSRVVRIPMLIPVVLQTVVCMCKVMKEGGLVWSHFFFYTDISFVYLRRR